MSEEIKNSNNSEIEELEEIKDYEAPIGENAKKRKIKKKMKPSMIAIIAVAVVVVLAGVGVGGYFIYDKFFASKSSLDISAEAQAIYKASECGLYLFGDNQTLDNNDLKRADKTLGTSYFDPSKPTIIFCHGWEASYAASDRYLTLHNDTITKAGQTNFSYVPKYKALGYNVATFQFQNSKQALNFAASLGAIFPQTWINFNDSGVSLACMFADELCSFLGNDYNQELTYVGHSCGAFVAVGINYYVDAYLDEGRYTNENLMASRMFLADPYVNAACPENATIFGTNENTGSRSAAQLVSNCVCNFKDEYNMPVEIFLGMSIASDSLKKLSTTEYNKIKSKSIIVDMTGYRSGYGDFNIHCLTRDFVLSSILLDDIAVTNDPNSTVAPSGASSREELLSFIGKEYKQIGTSFAMSESNSMANNNKLALV